MTDRLMQLAEEIAADLFRNGMGNVADRLVLELPGKRDGGGWCHGAARDRILTHLRRHQRNGHKRTINVEIERLSPRERETFRLLGCGFSTNRIANDLDLSPKTIETYRENIKEKLGLTSANLVLRVAAIWCWENGIDVEVTTDG